MCVCVCNEEMRSILCGGGGCRAMKARGTTVWKLGILYRAAHTGGAKKFSLSSSPTKRCKKNRWRWWSQSLPVSHKQDTFSRYPLPASSSSSVYIDPFALFLLRLFVSPGSFLCRHCCCCCCCRVKVSLTHAVPSIRREEDRKNSLTPPCGTNERDVDVILPIVMGNRCFISFGLCHTEDHQIAIRKRFFFL